MKINIPDITSDEIDRAKLDHGIIRARIIGDDVQIETVDHVAVRAVTASNVSEITRNHSIEARRFIERYAPDLLKNVTSGLVFIRTRQTGDTCEYRILETSKGFRFETSDDGEFWRQLDNLQIRKLRIADRRVWNFFARSEAYSGIFGIPESLPL